MKNENDEAVEAWIWDSGHWSDDSGKYTRSRIFSALRYLEESGGIVNIKGLRYCKSSAIGDRQLPHEPDSAHRLRIAHSANVRKQRVERTSPLLTDNKFKDDTNTEIVLPTAENRRLFVVTMPASEERISVVNQLLTIDTNARIVVAPPAFTELNELDSLIKIDTSERIIPFLPYRYSGGMVSVREHAQQHDQPIQAVLLNVISGPYPGRLSSAFSPFLMEFCLPAVDCIIDLAGRVKTGSTITYKEADMLPVIICNSIHETDIISSATLAATGNFGDVNFTVRVLFNAATLDLTDAFKHSVLRGGKNNVFTESGHDASGLQRNGYSRLLSNILTDSPDIPTLKGFRNTQLLVNGLVQALEKLSDGEHPQQQILTFPIGEEQK